MPFEGHGFLPGLLLDYEFLEGRRGRGTVLFRPLRPGVAWSERTASPLLGGRREQNAREGPCLPLLLRRNMFHTFTGHACVSFCGAAPFLYSYLYHLGVYSWIQDRMCQEYYILVALIDGGGESSPARARRQVSPVSSGDGKV